jgi:hypothetical protein
MEIIDNRGAPPELIRIANEACKEHKSVKRVIFDAFIEELAGAPGAFRPEDGTIIIDMGACLLNKAWMKKGIMYTANVWFNLVWTFFHELVHAQQLEQEPELMALDYLPKDYEDEACDTGLKSLSMWALYNDVPTLNEMGWVGEQIKILLNKMYAQMPQVVNEELDLQGTNLVAGAEEAAANSKEYNDQEEIALLLKSIDEGLVGGKVGNKKYLTAHEAIDLDHVEHKHPTIIRRKA